MPTQTEQQFKAVLDQCQALFEKKNRDYGASWRILRLPSLTDQINIKALRVRNIQEKGVQKIHDSQEAEFVGIINYCLMSLIQLDLGPVQQADLSAEDAIRLYTQKATSCHSLMMKKNHDYGEAWRMMRVSSITDIILMRILRIKQIEDHQGQVEVSEGIDANYMDVVNYSVFAIILLDQAQAKSQTQHQTVSL